MNSYDDVHEKFRGWNLCVNMKSSEDGCSFWCSKFDSSLLLHVIDIPKVGSLNHNTTQQETKAFPAGIVIGSFQSAASRDSERFASRADPM